MAVIQKHTYREPNKNFNPSAGCLQCGLPELHPMHSNKIIVETHEESIEILWCNRKFTFPSFSAARLAGFDV